MTLFFRECSRENSGYLGGFPLDHQHRLNMLDRNHTTIKKDAMLEIEIGKFCEKSVRKGLETDR